MKYRIFRTNFGFQLDCEGDMGTDDTKAMIEEFSKQVKIINREYSIIADFSEVLKLSGDAESILREAIKFSNNNGLKRASIIYSDENFKDFYEDAVHSAAFQRKYYFINSNENPNWDNDAIDWVENGFVS